ncbi:hook-length control protein FliK [Ectothiorhodospira mobilis]|uniref:Hook-length control protein FliK n=1 Tax=Ectothiorhodospira mobilis TaxID=195064 RepID=A0A1I4QIP6_ECTMO|nr:flagellar hook-length control protein FliK [Ectothiorhodospira mobilis]SFM39907.1 hook-length control protein FliK [Ectothiorhodospira mobilis]
MSLPPLRSGDLHIQLTQGGQSALRGLQPGQILQARVLTSAQSGGDTLLRLGGTGVEARLPVPVRAGQSLTLQVTAVHPRLQLTLLPASTGQVSMDGPQAGTPATTSPPFSTPQGPATGSLLPAGPPGGPTSGAAHAPLLRQWAPVQASQAPLMATLARLQGQESASMRQGLPPAVRQAMEALWMNLPRVEGITTGPGLRRALLDSGLFLEARLARAAEDGKPPPVGRDLKGRLLSLARQLRSLPPASRGGGDAPAPTRQDPPPPFREAQPVPQGRPQGAPLQADQWLATLQRQVEGSLARLVMHQLASAEKPEEPGQSPRWFLELPLKGEDGVDVVHMRLQREGGHRGGREDADHPWRADLALDLPGLGPLHVRVVVRGDQVTTQFWAEAAAGSERLQQALPRLRERLQARDLEVVNLQCRNAPPPPEPPARGDGPIVDGRA